METKFAQYNEKIFVNLTLTSRYTIHFIAYLFTCDYV